MTTIVMRKTQKSFREVLVTLHHRVTNLGERFSLREDIIRCIFALTYAEDPKFILKEVQGKGIYRTKFQVNPLAF